METKMFCRQCEQTSQGKGCTIQGVCGKDSLTAALQDLLIYSLKGIGVYGNMARELGVKDRMADIFVVEGLFATVTNVDFDPERLRETLLLSYEIREKLKDLFMEKRRERYGRDFSEKLPEAANWVPANTLEGLAEQGRKAGVMADYLPDEDVRSLRELLLYGLKGMAAYADHAFILDREDEEVTAYFYRALSLLTDTSLTTKVLFNEVMRFGKVNLKCLELLDKAHTEHFGNPVPTKVSLDVKKGPAIAVSGHDLLDLEELLRQTEDINVNIYTHGEMLPAHGYPAFKKYRHLAGHYGTAWQNQQKEFDEFPGAVLMTTNCIQKPRDSYKNNIFTTGVVAWPGVEHIYGMGAGKDFSKVIRRAIELGGFKEDKPGKEITVGFAHNAVIAIADKIAGMVRSKKIRHFFLIGGCDGAKPGRNYFTEFAQQVPQDCVIITLACGKFRFNTLDFGDIDGIPRLLDCGQCNDSYSAIKIAQALSDVFKRGINDLPISFILSWYEQKAVCILLTLFSLGIKNIRLGPSLPAFISDSILKTLADKFNIKPISTPQADSEEILGVVENRRLIS
ncbi:MAG: hydroxylamine reductase [Candidatus Omnitrophota bacterium]